MTPNIIEKKLDEILSKNRFNPNNASWVRSNLETVSSIQLQKSAHTLRYFINLGACIRRSASQQSPDDSLPCLNFRINYLLEDRAAKDLEAALDLENVIMDDETRCRIIEETIIKAALPFLDKNATEFELIKLIKYNQNMRDHANESLNTLVETTSNSWKMGDNLFLSIRKIINEYDPIGIISEDDNPDEYDAEVAEIVDFLKSQPSEAELSEQIYQLFVRMFDEELAKDRHGYALIAKEIIALVAKA